MFAGHIPKETAQKVLNDGFPNLEATGWNKSEHAVQEWLFLKVCFSRQGCECPLCLWWGLGTQAGVLAAVWKLLCVLVHSVLEVLEVSAPPGYGYGVTGRERHRQEGS